MVPTHPPEHLRNRFVAALLLDLTAGFVEVTGLVGLHGLLPVQVAVDAPLALTAWMLDGEGYVARALAVPVFLLVTALATRPARRSGQSVRLASGRLLFFQCMLILAAMASGVLLGPFPRPDHPAAVLTGLLLVAAMALQGAGAVTFWRERLCLVSTIDLARLAARLGQGPAGYAAARSQLARLLAFLLGSALSAALWPLAGFWSLAVPAAGCLASLLAFVPFDFARAAADIRRR